MFLRRLYSSLPSTRAGGSHSTISALPTKAKPQTRGRIKPRLTTTSTSTSLCKTKSPRSVSSSSISKSISLEGNNGRGRKVRRSGSTSLSNDRDRNEMNLVSDSNRYSVERLSIFDEQDPEHGQAHEENWSNSSIAPLSRSITENSPSPRLLFTHPKPSSDHFNSFKPIYLYPEQFKLHYTFTSPNHPLPLNLGTSIYTQPRKNQSKETLEKNINELFDLKSSTSTPNPVKSLQRTFSKSAGTGTGLKDHFKVVRNLSHPDLLHHLGDNGYNPWASFNHENDISGYNLSSQLSTKMNDLKESNDTQWENVLAKLEGKSKIDNNGVKEVEMGTTVDVEQKDANLDEVVNGLNDVLSKLGLSNTSTTARGRKNASMMVAEEVGLLGEEGVLLDSVKRKRKKKISKHKYKKRRKATRALRKRLGK